MEEVVKVGNVEGKDLYRQGFLSVYVDITSRCNLACEHCYAGCAPSPSKHKRADSSARREDPQIRELEELIDKVESGCRDRRIFYELSGGEPLMRKDWREILHLFLRTGREVYLFSNATLVDVEVAKELTRLQDEHGGRLKFNSSLDSHIPQIHDLTRGKYAETMEGLRLLRSWGVQPKIDVTINSHNKENIIDTFRFIAATLTPEIILGVLRPVFPITLSNKSLFVPYREIVDISRRLTEIAEQEGWDFYCTLHEDGKAYCDAGINHLLVSPSGDVTPCYSLRLPRHKIGNIHLESFESLLQRIRTFNKGRDRKVLLCEHLEDVYGDPPVRLERLD